MAETFAEEMARQKNMQNEWNKEATNDLNKYKFKSDPSVVKVNDGTIKTFDDYHKSQLNDNDRSYVSKMVAESKVNPQAFTFGEDSGTLEGNSISRTGMRDMNDAQKENFFTQAALSKRDMAAGQEGASFNSKYFLNNGRSFGAPIWLIEGAPADDNLRPGWHPEDFLQLTKQEKAALGGSFGGKPKRSKKKMVKKLTVKQAIKKKNPLDNLMSDLLFGTPQKQVKTAPKKTKKEERFFI